METDSSTDKPHAVLDEVMPFVRAMRANRETVNFVSFATDANMSIEERFAREAEKHFPDVPHEQHLEVGKMIHKKIHDRMNKVESLRHEGATEDAFNETQAQWTEEFRGLFKEITGDADNYYHYADAWSATSATTLRQKTLFNSLLITAVSDFEALVSRLISTLLEYRPDILRASERAYTFKELSEFDTMEEFRKHSIELAADEILRGGFDRWMRWFGIERKITIPEVTEDNIRLVEIFQRRHLLVHNGGIVNKFYLSKAPQAKHAPPLGVELRASERYLRNAVDELTIAGTKLSFALLQKVLKDTQHLKLSEEHLVSIAYDALKDESWRVAKEISDWHYDWSNSDVCRLSARVNGWLSTKMLDDLMSIQLEIENWDTSALAGNYRLARLALLNQNREAYELVATLLQSNEIGSHEWSEWPVLAGVRAFEAREIDQDNRIRSASYEIPHTE